MKRAIPVLLSLSLLLGLLLWQRQLSAVAKAAPFAGFTVNTTADTADANPGNGVCADANGNCSLRAAISEANALPGDDTITLPAGTYTQAATGATDEDANANGDWDIASNITLSGAGAGTTILQAAATFDTANQRVLDVLNGTVEVRDVTIRHGKVAGIGGGILVENTTSSATLRRLVVTKNIALSNPPLLSGFGGGIFSDRRLTLVDCALTENQANTAGGGVSLGSADSLFTGCTFSGNTAGNQGGGINFQGDGFVLQMANCTVSGNTANGNGIGGGICNTVAATNDRLDLINCTVVNNTSATAEGGGIVTGAVGNNTQAVTRLRNSIIANNTAPNLAILDELNGGPSNVGSLGHNLTNDGGGDFLTQPTDQINTNPLLAALASNGGLTQTHALQANSPALNAGHSCVLNNSCASNNLGFNLTTDQRGTGFPRGLGVDIGAYEAQGVPDHLAFSTQPVNTALGGALSTTVQVLDTANSVVTASTATINLSLGNNPSSATLGGTTSLAASAGSAVFSNLMVNKLGAGYTLTARSNGVLEASSNAFDIICPTFTVGTPANTGVLGSVYSSSAAASPAAPSGYKYQYSLANGTVLPSGLLLDVNTGVISGTPVIGGNFSFDLKAELLTTDNTASGCSNTQTRSINISCPTFTVGTPTATGALGTTYSSSVAASPAAPGGYQYQYSLANGTSLPSNLTLDATTGALTGTPVVGGVRSFDILVEVLDASNTPTGCSNTQTRTISIACPSFTIGTPTATGLVHTAYDSSVAASPAAPAGYNYQYSLANGTSLPPGVTLDGSSGALTGTLDLAGTYNFDIRVELFNAVNQPTGCSVTQARTISVTCPTPPVMPTPNPQGALGVLYYSSVGLGFSSGVSYQYSLANGTLLPGGLTLDINTGLISGTPTATGTFTFDVTVSGYGAGCSTTQTFTLQVVSCVSNPVVTNLNNSGPGSLRTAVATACSGSTVSFQSGLSGTLTLTSGDLLVGQNLTIQGPGAQVITLSGNQQRRIFTVREASLSVSGLRLSQGNGLSTVPFDQDRGGAIYYRGAPGAALTLADVTIADNSANGQGGGVYFGGSSVTLNVLRSTLAANQSTGLAGGLQLEANDATVNLMRSTITGNTADAYGGGIDLRMSGTLNIANCTIAGNQASSGNGGGIGNSLNGQVVVNLVNSTLTGNQGGGLSFSSKVSINARNTLIALNDGGDALLTDTSFTSNGYNVFGTGVPADAVQPTDQVGVNPLLELDGNGKPLLAFNGGPTQTIRLLPDSPALDRGGIAPFDETQVLGVYANSGTYTLSFNGQTTPALPYDAGAAAIQTALNALSTIGGVGGNVTVTQRANISIFGSSFISVVRFGGALAGGDQPLVEPATADEVAFEVTALVNGGPFSPLSTDQRGLPRPVELPGVPNASGGDGSDIGAYEHNCAALTLAALPNGAAGAAYNQPLIPSGGAAPYTITLTSGTLPPGLTLNGASLGGNPTAVGTYNFTLSVVDAYGCTGNQSYTLTTTCSAIGLSPATLPNATLNTAYPQVLTANPAGTAYSFTVTSGLLPNGLTSNPDGTFSGAPTQSGTFSFRVTATAFGTCSGFRDYTLLVNCPGVTLNPASLPGGTLGTPYNQSVSASPAGTYSYTVTSGALPGGLTLNPANGVISGTPTANGAFNFTLTAAAGGCTASRSYTVMIGCAGVSFTTTSLPGAQAGVGYDQTLGVSPAGSYSFSLVTGSLPPGLNLNAATGQLSGTASATGTYAFSVQALGRGGCGATQAFTLVVTCPAISVNPASLPNGTSGTAYQQSLSATPSGNYSFTKTSGTLPPGLTLNANGSLNGTPTTQGTYTFTVAATAFSTCSGSQSYTVTISSSCAAITLPALPTTGTVNVTYTGNLAATTPSASYTFSVESGTLPPGLTIDNLFGQLRGKPTAAGSYTFTLKATRSNGCTGTRAYTLTVGGGALVALARTADYDGDGKADLSLWSSQSGRWQILRSSDEQTTQTAWGGAGDVCLLGDYDGDGRSDLAVFRPSNGTWYVQRSSDGAALVKAWGAATDVPVPGDYDGDGQTDLAIFRPSEGNWYVLKSSDGAYEIKAWGLGVAPYLDVPVPGDYDGDGVSDLAVFRRQTGTWLIQRSSDGQFTSQAWGGASDLPVVGDYDGDGKSDLAVWRGATGQWLVLRSSDQGYDVTAWGALSAGDVPAPGDYDGDGQMDLTVWRAPEGRWYIRNSASAELRAIEQGPQTARPVAARINQP